MNATNRIASLAVAAALGATLLAPSTALAQNNPGQFGGSPPGQFDPNAQPGALPGAARPGQFDPNAQPGAQPGAAPSSSTPPGFSGPTDPNDPNARLDAAKEEDSGRGLTWFWLEAGGGFEHVGLQTIDASATCSADADRTGCVEADTAIGTGGMFEAGVGARLLFFTIGARGRLSVLDSFQLARIGPELGLRIPIGSIEPRISLGGGYAAALDSPTTGYYVRVGGGLDYFLASSFAIGADISGDLVGVQGEAAGSVQMNASGKERPEVLRPGGVTGTGLGGAIGIHVGLHR